MLLPEKAVERLTATVARMQARADALHADALVGFATSAIREARNGIEARGQGRGSAGGARLTCAGGRCWTASSARRLLVVDIGGGSLEVAAGETDRPDIAESLPPGGARPARRVVGAGPGAPGGAGA